MSRAPSFRARFEAMVASLRAHRRVSVDAVPAWTLLVQVGGHG